MTINVDLKEPDKIGLGIENQKPICFPFSKYFYRVDLIVTRGEDFKSLNSSETIAQITLECPEARCYLHKDNQKSNLRS